MDQVIAILLGMSLIIIFGYLSEVLFKLVGVPDVLFLMLLGIAVGPFGIGMIHPNDVVAFAPVFTTFALLFLLFEGAFNIDLSSFIKGLPRSVSLTLFNFLVSVIIIFAVLFGSGYSALISLLIGFILGGVSSAFVIPVIKNLISDKELFSMMTLESALTDVLCIVGAITILELITASTITTQYVLSTLISLFAVAGFVGILGGIVWILIVTKIFGKNKSYVLTIAYLILIYVITEYLSGNGAIAALFVGLVLKNSRQITKISYEVTHKRSKDHQNGYVVTTHTEETFFDNIAFFVKTFFFVYIGLLLDFSDVRILFLAAVISLTLMFSRHLTKFLLPKKYGDARNVVTAISARGLAAAAMAQLLLTYAIPGAASIQTLVYGVIFFTIVFSSASIFMLVLKKKKIDNGGDEKKSDDKSATTKKASPA